MDKETKNCKYCGVEIKNNLYCSEWCPKYRNKKKKDNFMNQTNNRIREEWRKKFHNLVGGTIVNKGKLLDTWSPSFTLEEMEDFIAELLKSQREELVKKIEKISDFADSGDTLKSRIINLIKNN